MTAAAIVVWIAYLGIAWFFLEGHVINWWSARP